MPELIGTPGLPQARSACEWLPTQGDRWLAANYCTDGQVSDYEPSRGNSMRIFVVARERQHRSQRAQFRWNRPSGQRGQRGQALVETAFVLPLLLFFCLLYTSDAADE